MRGAVPEDSLGLPGGARGIQDVQWVVRVHSNAWNSFSHLHYRIPVVVAALHHFVGTLRALLHHHPGRLALGQLDSLVHQRAVRYHLGSIHTARRSEDQLGLGVVDSGRQLRGRKATEDHGVDSPDARAGQHGVDSLGNHRHVDNHSVSKLHTKTHQDPGELGHVGLQLLVGDLLLGVGHRAIVDQGSLVSSGGHVTVNQIVAHRELAPGEPLVEGLSGVVHCLGVGNLPVDALCGLSPESIPILQRLRVHLVILGAVNASLGSGHSSGDQ
mmetsp:Transcript_59217/g.127571  ORF Transcript_59217/g.127571 Transcript_59217/m.127571 type:complete len:271 (+) Transcript_59217:1009-1821(+)